MVHNEPVPTDPTAQTIRLPDGRQLGLAEYGTPSGRAMVFLHGQPGSRLIGELLDGAAREVGVRLLSVDRPGIGLSDPVAERTHTQFAGDLTAVLGALGLGRTPVLAWSAGGPYALAWAVARPELVSAVGVLGGVGPAGPLDGAWAALRTRLGVPAGLPKLRGADAWSEALSRTWLRTRDAAGQRIDLAADAAPVLARGFREGVRQGTAAARLETRLLGGDWDFDPTAIRVPLLLWHGKDDALIPWSQTRELAARIPEARATLLPGEGHVSLLINHGPDILRTMLRAGSRTG